MTWHDRYRRNRLRYFQVSRFKKIKNKKITAIDLKQQRDAAVHLEEGPPEAVANIMLKITENSQAEVYNGQKEPLQKQ